MMKMVVHPHHGVGPLRLGMTRAETEHAVGMIPKRYVPNEYALEIDSFGVLGLVVMYDQGGYSNAISFVRGFGVDLEYEGYQLFAHPAREVRAWALAKDPQLDPKDGFTSKALGLEMWADWIDEPELEPDMLLDPGMSFLIFRPGYYEEEQARMAASGLLPGDS
ncbi:MAG: hypothetical protein ABI134_13670 [Byssovorax sp.]